MTRPAQGNLKAASKPALKSPLRASTMPVSSDATSSPGAADGSTAEPAGAEISATQLRKMQISEFSAWLRTQTNKHQRPFQEETIRDYAETARVLDLWMSREEIEEDFTVCDTALLNLFFAPTGSRTPRTARTPGSGTCTTCSSG